MHGSPQSIDPGACAVAEGDYAIVPVLEAASGRCSFVVGDFFPACSSLLFLLKMAVFAS